MSLADYQWIVEIYNNSGLDVLINFLKENGFKRISLGKFTDVYRLNNDKYVVKVCCRGDNALPRINRKRHSVINSYFVGYKHISFDSKVGVQDFVTDYFEVDKPTQKLLKTFIKNIKGNNDLHIGNVGLLNNKMVVFDF